VLNRTMVVEMLASRSAPLQFATIAPLSKGYSDQCAYVFCVLFWSSYITSQSLYSLAFPVKFWSFQVTVWLASLELGTQGLVFTSCGASFLILSQQHVSQSFSRIGSVWRWLFPIEVTCTGNRSVECHVYFLISLLRAR
jgi:hypothetical protein